jgi:uncharacterized glyoxalase superfamily protein PhnB
MTFGEQRMSGRDLWSAPQVVPSLAYEDVPRAVEWLTRAFGFQERAGARLSWDGGTTTWMELGDALVNLATAGGHDLHSPKSVGRVSHSLKVYVDNVDEHFERARAAGAVIVSEPEDGFWGGRIYRTVDLEGHRWEFSQKDRDLAAASWRLPPGVTRHER